MRLFKRRSKSDMRNLYFELCLFKHLYSTYKLDEQEQVLNSNHISPILDSTSPASKISRYFRLMNMIDYSKLSSQDRQYIDKTFNHFSMEENMEFSQTNRLFDKVIKDILNAPNQYVLYQYDGSARPIDSDDPRFFDQMNRIAPANHITFAIYYKQIDENCVEDDFRNYNIVADCSNKLQEQPNIAIINFSEVDLLAEHAVRL